MIAQGYLQIFGVVVNIAVIFQKFTLNINDVNQHIYLSINIDNLSANIPKASFFICQDIIGPGKPKMMCRDEIT